jgi:hypothetical protein
MPEPPFPVGMEDSAGSRFLQGSFRAPVANRIADAGEGSRTPAHRPWRRRRIRVAASTSGRQVAHAQARRGSGGRLRGVPCAQQMCSTGPGRHRPDSAALSLRGPARSRPDRVRGLHSNARLRTAGTIACAGSLRCLEGAGGILPGEGARPGVAADPDLIGACERDPVARSPGARRPHAGSVRVPYGRGRRAAPGRQTGLHGWVQHDRLDLRSV